MAKKIYNMVTRIILHFLSMKTILSVGINLDAIHARQRGIDYWALSPHICKSS